MEQLFQSIEQQFGQQICRKLGEYYQYHQVCFLNATFDTSRSVHYPYMQQYSLMTTKTLIRILLMGSIIAAVKRCCFTGSKFFSVFRKHIHSLTYSCCTLFKFEFVAYKYK
eukprot:58522_1